MAGAKCRGTAAAGELVTVLRSAVASGVEAARERRPNCCRGCKRKRLVPAVFGLFVLPAASMQIREHRRDEGKRLGRRSNGVLRQNTGESPRLVTQLAADGASRARRQIALAEKRVKNRLDGGQVATAPGKSSDFGWQGLEVARTPSAP